MARLHAPRLGESYRQPVIVENRTGATARDVAPGSAKARRALVEARLRVLAERPQIVGVHLCLGDQAASSVQTAEKRTRPTKALTPNWVVIVEGGGDRHSLRAACAELLPTAVLVEGGALDVARGLYQLQYQPG